MRRHMIRAALIAVVMFHAATACVQADEYHREDLRIAMAAADQAGLEAMLLRPSGSRIYPLALMSHGAPRGGQAARDTMSPYRMYAQAIEFARRGFAVLVVMRRGYGASG